MIRNKRLASGIILLIIIMIFIFTAAVDLSRFFGLYDFYNSYPNDLLKRINVLLAAALVWLVGKDSLSQKDSRLMKAVFILICIGEAFFLLAKPSYAITAFFVCQYLLVIRHSEGISKKLKSASGRQRIMLAASALILIAIIISAIYTAYPSGSNRSLSIIAASYLTILSMSLWTALANRSLGLFPKVNSKMAAIGMICFYFCDICVGLDGLLEGGMIWMLANSLIWIFYTPAITLLALSCYSYDCRAKNINKISLEKTRALK